MAENNFPEPVADWMQIEDSWGAGRLRDSPPSSFIHSPLVIGRKGTLALLSYHHNLLQVTSYDVQPSQPALIARTYLAPSLQSPDHLAGQFLLLSQSREQPRDGWGLRVDPPAGCRISRLERGFIDSKQPTRLKKYARSVRRDGAIPNQDDETVDVYIEKSTSYVRSASRVGPGSLVQAMVVACKEPGLGVTWHLGGQIQLVPGQSSRNSAVDEKSQLERLFRYTVDLSHNGRVLTVKCRTTARPRSGAADHATELCLDMILFINGEATQLSAQPGQPAVPIADFVDISQRGQLVFPDTQPSFSLVAVISVRNPLRHENPILPEYPALTELRRKLMVEDGFVPAAKPLAELLSGPSLELREKLREIPNIIAAALHRVLGSLVTYQPPGATPRKYPVRNPLHGYPLENDADPEECLWLLRILTFIADNFNDHIGTRLKARIRRAIRGLLDVLLEGIPLDRNEPAYMALGLCLSWKYLRPTYIDNLPENITNAIVTDAERPGGVILDPTTRLLQWAHRMAISRLRDLDDPADDSESDDGDSESGTESGAESGNEAEPVGDEEPAAIDQPLADPDEEEQPAAPDTLLAEPEAANLEDTDRSIQDYHDLALDRSGSRLSLGLDVDSDEECSEQPEDLSQAISREEKGSQIALLVLDLLSNTSAQYRRRLLDEVQKRQAVRETDRIGRIPPWGLRFRDHGIRLELATIRRKLDAGQSTPTPTQISDEILQDATDKLSYFGRSNFSVLSCVSEMNEPEWASSLWSLDSLDACCSLLGIIEPPRCERLRERQAEQQGTAGEAPNSTANRTRFPWQRHLIHARQYYPSFIRQSLDDRQLQADRERFNSFYAGVHREDGDNKLVKMIGREGRALFAHMSRAQRWLPEHLRFGNGDMRVLDFSFPHMRHYSDMDLRRLLYEHVSVAVAVAVPHTPNLARKIGSVLTRTGLAASENNGYSEVNVGVYSAPLRVFSSGD
ncbi:uncharacterized protein Z520_02622 [Fonsecaea multimorphosa CBS 102226]|uniref:Uncharacterized protein n=1 Tax=Fonsecaea multimorphosa CBS 102226 TaxID=1442371 RepID=A0A0D2K8U6_9EURO|nr:uncharacterized protein Z520_02622 [Fonsecaea multimorphosa CBS 102226]KIY02483.1 hypothetical protein Z520_02622 [Fonsecaea multimorphosa CBS 102226]